MSLFFTSIFVYLFSFIPRISFPSCLPYVSLLARTINVYFLQIEFVDIAGIVKGASEGAGLGNKFLMNIRATDAIVHVVRCFVDDDIIHVDGNVDPIRDVEIICLELILADLAQIEKKLEKVSQ